MKLLPQLLQATWRCLCRYEGQAREQPILVAASGGIDSSVLAFVLATLRQQGRLGHEVVLGHVDHAVWPGSEQAAAAVAEQARLLGVGFLARRLASPGASEEALREARYAALGAMARESRAGLLLTAHHADDNLETVLFRMLRGTGPRGLCGIPEARHVRRDLLLVRPFLNTRRHTLETAWRLCQSQRQGLGEPLLPQVDDPTNQDLRFSRNHLRHELMPHLRKTLGAKLDASLFALARSARATADVLEAQARRLLRHHARFPVPWRCELWLPSFERSDRPFLAEALAQLHQRLDPSHRVPGWRWADRVLDLLHQPAGRRVTGPRSLLVERTREGLLILDPSRAGAPPGAESPEVPPLQSAQVRFGSTEWSIRCTPHQEPPLSPGPGEAGPRRALLDLRGLARPWRLRCRRPDDRFRPLGLDRQVSLRRFLMNRHVPRFDRDRLPLVVDARDRVLWVPGVEIFEDARIRLDTRGCVELQLVAG